MTTKTKKTETRKKAATKPKAETTKPIEAEEQKEQPAEIAPLCPKCGDPMVRRVGPHGPFYGCSNFKSGVCKATIKIEQ